MTGSTAKYLCAIGVVIACQGEPEVAETRSTHEAERPEENGDAGTNAGSSDVASDAGSAGEAPSQGAPSDDSTQEPEPVTDEPRPIAPSLAEPEPSPAMSPAAPEPQPDAPVVDAGKPSPAPVVSPDGGADAGQWTEPPRGERDGLECAYSAYAPGVRCEGDEICVICDAGQQVPPLACIPDPELDPEGYAESQQFCGIVPWVRCDGPEDCPDGERCVIDDPEAEYAYGSCSSMPPCGAGESCHVCHVNAHCGPGGACAPNLPGGFYTWPGQVCGEGLAAFLDQGNWLIGGESDGVQRYSWVEFTQVQPEGGTILVSDLVCESCDGWLPCEGEGTYSVYGPEIAVELPSDCDAQAVWIFDVFKAIPYGTGSGVMASCEVTVDGVVYGATVHQSDSSCDVLPEICGGMEAALGHSRPPVPAL